jgi:hypothetical protein
VAFAGAPERGHGVHAHGAADHRRRHAHGHVYLMRRSDPAISSWDGKGREWLSAIEAIRHVTPRSSPMRVI